MDYHKKTSESHKAHEPEPSAPTKKAAEKEKRSTKLVPFPLKGSAGAPVALVSRDAKADDEPKLGGTWEKLTYPCVPTDVGVAGADVYLDLANDRLTTIPSTHNRAGRLVKAKQVGETEVEIYLNMP